MPTAQSPKLGTYLTEIVYTTGWKICQMQKKKMTADSFVGERAFQTISLGH